jgi:predicted alpha/beta superfamily hydrolase
VALAGILSCAGCISSHPESTMKVRINDGHPPSASPAAVTGDLRFHPSIGGTGIAPRMVTVWLPPCYNDEPERRYPVLYMHDGQNCFDPARSAFGMEWRMDEEATRLIGEGRIEHLIIVAVDCNGAKRIEEYGDTALGAAYRDYLIQVVKPLVDRTYRTKPDRDNTAVMGSSMGGCVSFLLLWEHPEIFSRAGCLSPAFDVPVTERVRLYQGERKPIRFYMDNGEVGLEKKIQKHCDRMMALLPGKGFQEGLDYQWFLDAGAEHNENAWAARVWRPLEFMFGICSGDTHATRKN